MAPLSLISSMQRIPLQILPDDVHQSSSSEGSLTDLSEDIFIEILGQWLELSSVLSLRMVCKRLAEVTHMRELWIALARRLVIGEGLPWPQYALPLFDMPSETIESLTTRSLRMKLFWSTAPLHPAKSRGPSALIRYEQGQITWLHIVRSKWVVVGLRDCSLALWDAENVSDKPLATFAATEGFVLSGVTQSNGHELTLTVNTNVDHTYRFDMDLPLLAVQYQQSLGSTNFVLKKSFGGYTTILDDYESLLAFSKPEDENIPVIVDLRQGAAIRLRPGDGVTKLQYTVAVQIRPDIVIVVKDWNVELYPTAIIRAELKTPFDHYVQPIRSFSHPGDSMMWRLGLQPRPAKGSLSRSRPIYMSGVGSGGWRRWTIQKQQDPISTYNLVHNVFNHLHFVDNVVTKVCWGESGARIAYIGDSDNGIAFCSFAYPPLCRGNNDIVQWVLPFNDTDFPWLCDADEATGMSAVGTACGRIWIVDPASRMRNEPDTWEAEIKP